MSEHPSLGHGRCKCAIEPFVLGVRHSFLISSAIDWHVQVEKVTATISCLIGEHGGGILLTDRIASLAKEISMRGLFPPSAVLAELSSEAQSRIAHGDTVESVEKWLDSLTS